MRPESSAWPGRRLAMGLLLVLLADGAILLGVARNRLAEPDSRLRLTELALRAAQVSARDDTRHSLRFVFRDPQPRARASSDDPLDWRTWITPPEADVWLDQSKLAELGFRTDMDPTAPAAEHFYAKELPRRVYLVLAVDGAGSETELRAVDAGLDPAVLRSRYADRTRYAITRGNVRLLRENDSRLRGRVESLAVSQIDVPRRFSAVLKAPRIPPSGGSTPATPLHVPGDAIVPRYRATVAFGHSHSPWLTDLEALSPTEAEALVAERIALGMPCPMSRRIESEYRITEDMVPCLEPQFQRMLAPRTDACVLRRESGRVSADSSTPGWTLHRGGGGADRTFTWSVRFTTPFAEPPQVLSRPTYVELGRADPPTAITEGRRNITREGFDLFITVGEQSHLWAVKMSWIAVQMSTQPGCQSPQGSS